MRTHAELSGIICGLVADTFDQPIAFIKDETRVEDVPGWDSLGHSVLITRLTRRLGVRLEEAEVAFVETVGELVARAATWRTETKAA